MSDIVDLHVLGEDPTSNVVMFGEKEKEKPEFDFNTFIDNITKNKDNIEHFFYIGVDKDGNSTVSAKADNNLHLHWILKRFITHLESHLYG